MGSVELVVRCPDCGMNAYETYYHHNGSFDIRCPVCGFYCHRIIPGRFAYEESDLDGNVFTVDPAANYDIDGYARLIEHTKKDVNNLIAHVREDKNTYNGVEITQDENGEYWAINKFTDNESRILNMQIPKEYYDLFEDAVIEFGNYEEVMGPIPDAEERIKDILRAKVHYKFRADAEKQGIDVDEYIRRIYDENDKTFNYREGKVKIIFDKVDKFADLSESCLKECNRLRHLCHGISDKIYDRDLRSLLDSVVLGLFEMSKDIEKMSKYR